jgi:23S rRNA pseudouridine1911/1915/1917 synthase
MSNEIDTIFITDEEAGERLDKVLARRFEHLGSRSYFQFLIEEHKVLVNGTPVKKRQKLKAGDEVEIELVLTPELDLTPQEIPLDILYEDSDLLVINKPAGMVVHPAPGNWSGTFVNALLFHCRLMQKWPETLRPGIVHRLDKDTTGLLVAAKTSLAQQRLIGLFASRRIHKEYLAICLGNTGDREIEAPIGRHPVHRQRMTVLPEGGRTALTICKTLAFNGKMSLVNLVLATGRTHQIRVHLKYIGAPILGDPIYGDPSANKKYRLERQMLHASLLRFQHPMTKETLEFRAEPPEDMKELIQTILAR